MSYKYDIAISYATEQIDYVKEIVQLLDQYGVRTFVDYKEPERLWGEYIPEELRRVYSEESRVILIFLSKEYATKSYTRFESRIVCERSLAGDTFLIIKMDEVTLPWLNSTIGLVDNKMFSPGEIVRMLAKKFSFSITIENLFQIIKNEIHSTFLRLNTLNEFDVNIKENVQLYEITLANRHSKKMYCMLYITDIFGQNKGINLYLDKDMSTELTEHFNCEIAISDGEINVYNYGFFRGNSECILKCSSLNLLASIRTEVEKLGEAMYD